MAACHGMDESNVVGLLIKIFIHILVYLGIFYMYVKVTFLMHILGPTVHDFVYEDIFIPP